MADTNQTTPNPGTKPDDTGAQGAQAIPAFKPGSTTQGGSNYGQGSSQLGPESYDQGEKKSDGSNYKNEEGFDPQK